MDCLLACTGALPRCRHFTWFAERKLCELADADCKHQPDHAAEATYATTGPNVISSAVVSLEPGANALSIEGVDVQIDLPKKGAGVRGVIIADPCTSAKYAGCAYGERWATFNKTTEMMNALVRLQPSLPLSPLSVHPQQLGDSLTACTLCIYTTG